MTVPEVFRWWSGNSPVIERRGAISLKYEDSSPGKTIRALQITVRRIKKEKRLRERRSNHGASLTLVLLESYRNPNSDILMISIQSQSLTGMSWYKQQTSSLYSTTPLTLRLRRKTNKNQLEVEDYWNSASDLWCMYYILQLLHQTLLVTGLQTYHSWSWTTSRTIRTIHQQKLHDMFWGKKVTLGSWLPFSHIIHTYIHTCTVHVPQKPTGSSNIKNLHLHTNNTHTVSLHRQWPLRTETYCRCKQIKKLNI